MRVTIQSHRVIYHSFSFCGCVQDYKIRMEMEIVTTVQKSNKNILVTRPTTIFDVLGMFHPFIGHEGP